MYSNENKMLIMGQKKSCNFGDVDNSRGTLAFDLPPRGFNKATYCIMQPWIITAYIYTILWVGVTACGLMSCLVEVCSPEGFLFIILSISF